MALAWTDGTGETGFGIWRNVANDSATATFVDVAAANATSFDDVTATPGTEYYYWVTATNASSSSMGDFQATGALGRRMDPNLPKVTTADVSGITAGGANGGGTVTDQGTTLVTERGVVWSTSPNPTVADGQDVAAGGGAGAFTNYLAGLVANQTYYVRAYAVNAAGTVYGAQKSFATPCFSGVPTDLYASETNGTDFTAAWTPVPGAASYRIDASTNEYFMEGDSIAAVRSENFDNFTTVGGTDRSGELDTFMQTTGWVGAAVFENGGEVKMGSGSTRGYLTTPTLNLSSNGGQAVFTFDARYYSASDASKVQVHVTTNGTTWLQSGSNITLTADMVTYTNLITNGTATCKVRLQAINASNERFFLDNWKIEQGLGEPSFLPGYSNRLVTASSVMVTNLATNSYYYFRVRAEGNGDCVSLNSATAEVMTRDLSPAGPGNLQASDGTSLDYVHVTWNDVAVAVLFGIYRNTLDEFDTATAIATNFRAGNVLLAEDFVDWTDWTNGGTAEDNLASHYGAGAPCRALGANDALTSPPVNYPTQLTFHADTSASGTQTTNYYSLDGGSTWMALGTFVVSDAGATVTQALTATPNLSQSTNVLFRFVSAFNTWYLDDVEITGGSPTNFFDTTTAPGAPYWYFVVATNSYGGNESQGDLGWRGLAAVAGVNATDGAHEDRVAVTWTDLDGGETGYAVWRSETADPADAECLGEAGAEAVLFDDGEALPGQPYYYWIRATNSASESMGDWGTPDVGYRKLSVAGFDASFNDFDDRVELTWTDSEGETGYMLFRHTADDFAAATNIASDIGADATSYSDEDALTSTVYYYWLIATNEYSASISAVQAAGVQGRRAPVAPTVATLPVSNNVLGSAMCGGDVLAEGGSAITNRGVVWNTGGLPTIADSHTADGAGAGLGTYASTISPTTGGVTYYVRAYAQNGERIAYGQQVSFVAECSSELPTTLAATAVGPTNFTANWNAMGGVTSYRVDVSTNETFLGGYDANVAAWHNGTLGEGTGGTWTEENLLQSAGYVALRTNAAVLATPAINFNAGSSEALTFKARIFGGGGNGDFRNKITVSLSTDGGATWTNLGTRTPLNTTMTAMEPFDLSLVAGTNVRVRLQALSSSGGLGAGVVDVMVTNVLDPRGVFIPGYSNRTVDAATSLVVTGLLPEVTYYYRVRAESSGGCTSGNSENQPVITTTDVPEDPAVIAASDGTSTNHVALEWGDVLTETAYYLYRNTSDNFLAADRIHTNAMSVTNWLDETAAPGQRYYYWVSGTNQNGEGDPSVSDAGYRRLGAVPNVDASQGTSSNHVTITWGDVAGETGYGIWRNLNNDTNTAECVGTVAAGTLTFDDVTAIPGWDYHYWVLATNSTSESTGPWSDPPAVGYRTPISNPTATFALDGREMVRAEIAANGTADPVIVLHSTVGTVLAYPGPYTNTYAAGDVITVGTNSATVVYKGAPAGFREHVVTANTTNHYRIFSILTNTYYSDGLIVDGLASSRYPSNVYAETFSYTNVALSAGSFSNKSGGYLWSGAWSLSTAGSGFGWTIQTNVVAGTPAWNVIQTNYPTVVGNRAVLEANGVGHNAAYRAIAATNSGTIFVAAIVAYQYDGATEGANKYMTIGLMNDTDTELEFGKVYGRQNFFDIRRNDANGTVSTYQMHGWGESGRSTNDWYWMVVKYDFSAGGGTAYANCYYQGQNIPYEEPTTWDVEWSGMGISEIDGIELKGGSGTAGWLGTAIWDEIRISSVWPSLIGQPNLQPWPSPVDFGEVESTLSSNLTVWIANLGGDNVPLIATNEYAFNLTGPDAGYFALATNRFSSILTLGQSNGLGVTFWPTNAGVVEYTNAWLMVSNNSGLNPYPIQLMGLGVPTVSTNEPVVSNYFVGEGRWLTDAMVTSGVFAVTAEVYHVRGIRTATYDLLNGDGDVILANEAFATWSSTDGFSFVLSDAAHPGYWPATPSTNYHLRVNLESSNLIAAAQTIYTADGVVTAPDLFFSEYVEGTSDNKALEIFNGTGVATNLSNYGIRFKMNNSADWDTFYDYMALPDVVLQPAPRS